MDTIGALFAWLVVVAIVVAVVAYFLYFFYRRSTKEVSFVRTGFGGQRVVVNGGAIVLPIIHDRTLVNMSTLRLEVRRAREQALITRDRMRVDVVAEFYVRVAPNPEAISIAAQTLGSRTMKADGLKELVEGRFVDALRSVAAEMSMEEMHVRRGDYVKRVRATVAEDLALNGLELESVSLTSLDQTPMEYFNPSNAFDAEGLTRLTQEIEQRKKIRNDIEQDTAIQIRNKNLEAEKVTLEIERESEYARLAQERELEIRRAMQRAELARERAEQERTAEEAQLTAREQVERIRIQTERRLEEERISREREVQRLEVDRRKALELAEQERQIAIAEQSRAQSEALARAEEARALAVAAEERVFSAREVEQAERRKRIELIAASQEAERDAVRLRTEAEAERLAATDRAEAARIAAEAEAEADKIRAAAARLRYEIEAEGTRQMNEAQNVMSPDSRTSAMRLKLIDKLEAIIRESVRPMERIEGIKILHVDGLGMNGHANGDGGNGVGIADSVVNSALRYRAQAPLVDQLLREIGIEGVDIGKLAGGAGPRALGEPDESKKH
ncbi:flotillin family protein [Azospirillum sp.]|uniref:flotillin family protein n=1 Tax=Azospirillum sp. TaxID=34012 RepID=UPI002D3B3EF1|nr:flotillin domain-containing protein [Azospirillum sp.]HYD65635.1 flotillin domain-containing protein [Azospirillum sp.]